MGNNSDRRVGRRPWEKALASKAATMVNKEGLRQVVPIDRAKELEGKGWRRVD